MLKIGLFLCCIEFVLSGFYINPLFSDNVILQTNTRAGVRSFMYGTANENDTISVDGTLGSYSSDVINSFWDITIDPHSINARGNATIMNNGVIQRIINNITFGETIVCGGDNVMNYPIKDLDETSYNNIIDSLGEYVNIHFAKIDGINADSPTYIINNSSDITWNVISPSISKDILGELSVICYLTAVKYTDYYKRFTNQGPSIGIIDVSVNNSSLNCWMSSNAIKNANDKCGKINTFQSHVCSDSSLYNGMLYPILTQTYRAYVFGLGYYDALYNSDVNSDIYACQYSVALNDWRDQFGSGDFAFVGIELNSMNIDPNENVGNIRYQIAKMITSDTSIADTTASTVTYDNPSYSVIADRTAALLSRIGPVTITDNNMTLYYGPTLKTVDNSNGKIVLYFDNLNDGKLVLKGSNNCTQCCKDTSKLFEIINSNNATSYVTVNDISLDTDTISINVSDVNAIMYGNLAFMECGIYTTNTSIPLQPFKWESSTSKDSKNILRNNDNINGFLSSPPMGFNHWNAFHCDISDRLLFTTANIMESTGLKDAGYTYINLDDCWQTDRNLSTSTINTDSVRFPRGMKQICDDLHSMGFKCGIYTARTAKTCQSRDGSYQYEYQDTMTYCEWGIDYIKVDVCGGDSYPQEESWEYFANGVTNCTAKYNHTMALALSSCGTVSGCGQYVTKLGNIWRVSGDVQATFQSVLNNADASEKLGALYGPTGGLSNGGRYNDADMLEIGNPGLNIIEQMSHMNLWCILNSPLLIGTNLGNINRNSLDILLNTEIIAVNQDTTGAQGYKLNVNTSGTEIWYKPINNGVSSCVIMLNRYTESQDIILEFNSINVTTSVDVRDLWQHKDLGTFNGKFIGNNIPSHGSLALKLTPNNN